ncbi:MAG: hypothetical protein GZ089_09955 [Aromatoleum sp.]|nr:hypothetical protein [Aromatoleum sp.]
MGDPKLHRFETDAVAVTWDAGICSHSAECVRALPGVFDPKARPWVRPEAADADALEAAIARCPSGALTFVRRDAVVSSNATGNTMIPPLNIAAVQADGPYVCTGDFSVAGASATAATVVLCRCGASGNKPYCDGSHVKIGFRDAGLLPASATAGAAGPGKEVTITPRPNGPLKFEGALTIAASDGRTTSADPAFLCRCGNSQTKPFCDGGHKKVGFVA